MLVDLHSVAFGNNPHVAAGARGTILTSPDGITWINRISETRTDLLDITFIDGKFYVVGKGGIVLPSSNGLQWEQFQAPTHWNLQSIAGLGNSLVAVGEAGTILQAHLGVASSPRFASIRLIKNQGAELQVTAQSGMTFRVESSPDLLRWSVLTNVPQSAGALILIDPKGSSLPNQFYRLRVQ